MRLFQLFSYACRAVHFCCRLASIFSASRQVQNNLVKESKMDVDIAAQLEVFIKQIFEDEIRPNIARSENEKQLIQAYQTMAVEFNNLVTRFKGLEARMAAAEKLLAALEKMPANLLDKLAGAIASAK
jgi:hypothetical protein